MSDLLSSKYRLSKKGWANINAVSSAPTGASFISTGATTIEHCALLFYNDVQPKDYNSAPKDTSEDTIISKPFHFNGQHQHKVIKYIQHLISVTVFVSKIYEEKVAERHLFTHGNYKTESSSVENISMMLIISECGYTFFLFFFFTIKWLTDRTVNTVWYPFW